MLKTLAYYHFITYVFLVFFSLPSITAQKLSPLHNMDSLTEASHERMLARQAAEKEKPLVYPVFIAPEYDSAKDVYAVDEVPSPRGNAIFGYISDPEHYLTTTEEQRLNELLYELEQKSSAEIVIVLVPSIGEQVPKHFATALFEAWGIGKTTTDNGLLILTVMDQRRTEFEVGYGLEPILTDALCYRIGVNELVPHFKQGDFGKGLENAVLRIKEFLENPAVINEIYGYGVEHTSAFTWQWYHYFFLIYGVIALIFGFWYFGQAFDIQLSKDDYYDKYHRLEKLKFGCLQVLFPLPMLFFSMMVRSRLKKYRYAPRYSKKNGKLLKLKDEWAENEFLETAQILEEKLNSVRYDVWVTDDESDLMILEYEGPNGRKYDACKKCSYKTFGKKSSTIIKAATYDDDGERIDHYECRNCNFQEDKTRVIPQKIRHSSSSSSGSGSYSSSSSSSSFGGGSSGGGGAGVSW